MWMWLATAVLGCAPAYQEVPAWLVASTRTPFPLRSHRTTILDAVDGDPGTAWHAETGEIGTFFAAGNHVEAIRIDGDVSEVAVRTFRPLVWDHNRVGHWSRQQVPGNGFVKMHDADWAVEIRVSRRSVIHSVALLSRTPGEVQHFEDLVTLGKHSGSGVILEHDAVRFGRVDLANCVIESPGNMPDGAYVGDIDCTSTSFRLDGSNPYRGQVVGTFGVEPVGACLRMVDGWPMRQCR